MRQISSHKTYWQRFKTRRLSLVSLWLLVLIFVISLAAPLIANDKPLAVRFDGRLIFPIFQNVPEAAFGGVFESEADYQDPVVQAMIAARGSMLMPPIAYGEQSLVMNASAPHPAPPTQQNWLGTDTAGRDVLSRLLYALRVSLSFGLALTLFGSVLGVATGSAMGYFGGRFDLVAQRLLEVWLGLPQLFVLMILSSVLSPSVGALFVLMLLFGWMTLVPMTRVSVLRLRAMPFVLAAQNLGAPPMTIILRHILPSVLLVVIAELPFAMIANISALTTLDFLGFGLPVGSASLGELLAQGKNHLDAPHLVLSGFVTLTVVLCLLIFIAEGLRYALDTTR